MAYYEPEYIKRIAIHYGFDPEGGKVQGMSRPYRYSNACLTFHHEQATKGGWFWQDNGGGWLSKKWNQRTLRIYLAERRRWEADPKYNTCKWEWDDEKAIRRQEGGLDHCPSLLWVIFKPIAWILGVTTVLAILLGMLILAIGFPVFGVFLLIGSGFATMGGNGDMPEKEL